MRRSLFIELLRQQMLIALVSVALIGVAAGAILFPRLTEELEQSHQSIAKSVADQVSAYLDSTREHLKLVALDIINNPNSAQLSNRLDGFTQVSQIFETVYVTDIDNKIAHIGLPISEVGTRRLFLDMDLSTSQAWKTDLAPGQASWSNVYVSPITGQQSVALQTQLGLANLIAEIDILEMPALSKKLSRDEFLVMLLDQKANLIAHPDPEISQQQFNMGFAPLFIEDTDIIRTGVFTWDGVDFHATVVPLESTRWQVVIAEPLHSFRSTLNSLIFIWVAVAIATLFLTTFFAYRSAITQSKPVTRLTAMIKKISSGEYELEGQQSNIEEFQSVSNAFVDMANRVRNRESELTELNTELEGRVEARTAELTEMNGELSESVLRLENTMEQLVQSEKLASLGSLVAGVAHELNTPIGNGKIAVSSQFDYVRDIRRALEENKLTKSMFNQFVEDIAATTDMSYRNLERASELIRSFKQIAVDQTSSNKRDFNLATLVSEVLVTLQPTLRKYPATIEASVPDDIDMHSMPGPLSQILTNLINNAVFHGLEEQEDISIFINAYEQGGSVYLSIRDTGIGMSDDAVKRAFDPFFTTKMGQGGSGLGLNIVHRMTKGMLKGEIYLTSTLGEGTTFQLILPLAVEEADASVEAESRG